MQQQLNYPLRIFTLNYDLCVESIAGDNFNVETGFGDYGPQNLWDYERFNDSPTSGDPAPEIFLYKLHGSINWKRDEQKRLYQVRQVQSVESSSMELIFGREFKLEAADPYLFYAYEFRRLTTGCRLIVTIGYGFADEHINKLLSQALLLQNGPNLVVFTMTGNIEESKQNICQILEVKERERITVQNITARSLLELPDLGDKVASLIPSELDPFTLQEDEGSE
ncbi:SIR2 family protein [Geitlerinema splendidum]|nr:SIR2 family protein [Geitlerinema splendidum]